MFALGGSLVVRPVRRMLISALCFAIALLALRDALGVVSLPPAIDYVFLEMLYPYVSGVLALLAAGAGLVEALIPGSVVGRRYYFGTAALYLLGHGILGMIRDPSAGSTVLVACGAMALIGVFLAHRIVAREEMPEPEDDDLAEMHARMKHRTEALLAKEWRDKPHQAGG